MSYPFLLLFYLLHILTSLFRDSPILSSSPRSIHPPIHQSVHPLISAYCSILLCSCSISIVLPCPTFSLIVFYFPSVSRSPRHTHTHSLSLSHTHTLSLSHTADQLITASVRGDYRLVIDIVSEKFATAGPNDEDKVRCLHLSF